MSLRPTLFTDTYTPGKRSGATRQVTVENIPAEEIVHDGLVTDVIMTFEVAERIDVLIERALRANDLLHQHVTYTPSNRCGAGARAGVARSARRRKPPQPSSSGGGEVK
jgi:hypothetical protein